MVKLNRKIGRSRKKDDKPEMYDSPLFSKGEELPVEGLESIEPEEDERPVSTSKVVSKSKEAIDRLFTISKSGQSPDTTGRLEGKFTVSVSEMISLLNELLEIEYSQWFRYYHYALVLRGLPNSVFVSELIEHAEEELEHAEAIASRIRGLGGYPVPAIKRPASLKKFREIAKELLYREQEGVDLYRKVLSFCGANEGTRQLLESNIASEQEHIDDLWMYLNVEGDDISKADMSAGRTISLPESRKKQEYEDSFSRFTEGEAGGSTPDLPDRGRDWHGTVPGVPDEPQDVEEKDSKKEDKEEVKETKEVDKYLDRPPKDLLARKSGPTDDAIKALSGAARFSSGPFIPPREREYMLANGFTEAELDSGATMTPRMRAEFNRDVSKGLSKSLGSFDKIRR